MTFFERYDKPDWWQALSEGYLKTLERTRELATLLPVNVSQSCRGKIIFLHDFAKGWNYTGSGSSNASCFGGVTVNKAIFPFPVGFFQAAPNVNDNFNVIHTIYKYYTGKLAMELIYQMDNSDFDLYLTFESITSPSGYQAQVLFEGDTGDVWVQSTVPGTTRVASGNNDIQTIKKWNWIKILADFNTSMYETMWINETEIDISSLGLDSVGAVASDIFYDAIQVSRQAIGTTRVYCPYVLITQEEE